MIVPAARHLARAARASAHNGERPARIAPDGPLDAMTIAGR